ATGGIAHWHVSHAGRALSITPLVYWPLAVLSLRHCISAQQWMSRPSVCLCRASAVPIRPVTLPSLTVSSARSEKCPSDPRSVAFEFKVHVLGLSWRIPCAVARFLTSEFRVLNNLSPFIIKHTQVVFKLCS